jgi:vacuolar-type H+-ATPase subunit I/STV1
MIAESVQQVLTTLYPLYKSEVYKRREHMMRLTLVGSIGFLAMLFALLLGPQKRHLSWPDVVMLGSSSLVWYALIAALILQQQSRHRQAKQVLVQLEQALGFFEEGLFVANKMLYPDSWKTAWINDRSQLVYFVSLGILDGLFLAALTLV